MVLRRAGTGCIVFLTLIVLLCRFETRLSKSIQVAAAHADYATCCLLEVMDDPKEASDFFANMGGVRGPFLHPACICIKHGGAHQQHARLHIMRVLTDMITLSSFGV